MKRIIIAALSILSGMSLSGQKKSNALQISPFVRMDWYPEFSYNINGRPSTDYLKIKGISPGININYRWGLQKKFSLITGIGVYKFSFNKLSNTNTLFGSSDSRDIDYPSPIQLGWGTNRYSYDCASINLGFEKSYELKREFYLNVGALVSAFFTFHQSYKIPADNNIYKTNNIRLFAQTFLINAGIKKKMKKIELVPHLLIPVFDIWHSDNVFFGEMDSQTRNKWLNGIGFGIQINFLII